MTLSIIILNYKSLGLVKNCLKSIEENAPIFEYEIIIVDNNSADGSVAHLRELFPNVTIVESSRNLGFGAGNNQGLKIAKGDYALIANPDILFLDNAITKLVDFMKKTPKSGICGPRLVSGNGQLQNSCGRFPDWRLPFYRRTILGRTNSGKKWLSDYLMKDFDHLTNRRVDWLFAACVLIRKNALDQVGFFDQRFFMYMEDLDLCRRFGQANWQVWYLATAEVVHLHQRDSAELGGLKGLFSKSGRTHFISWLKYSLKYLNK